MPSDPSFLSSFSCRVFQSVMSNGEIWLDPTTRELEHSRASLTLACMPALALVTNVSQGGQITPQETMQVRSLRSQFVKHSTEIHSAWMSVKEDVQIFTWWLPAPCIPINPCRDTFPAQSEPSQVSVVWVLSCADRRLVCQKR